jgi:glutathione synthase
MKLAFITDPLASLKIAKDSTYAMMREAAHRGHDLYALRQEDLIWRDNTVIAQARTGIAPEAPSTSNSKTTTRF